MLNWFSRSPAPSSALQGDRIALVVGLGNPGPRYSRTRHNLGFLVLDHLAERHGASINRNFKRARTGTWASPSGSVLLAEPQTFMNDSGSSVGEIARFYHFAPANILVVCDDVSLPFGKLRLRPSGSEGGHNGLRSISQALGARDYPRLRVGVGHPGDRRAMIDYVLEPFSKAEWEAMSGLLDRAADAVEMAIAEGVQAAMNRFNGA